MYDDVVPTEVKNERSAKRSTAWRFGFIYMFRRRVFGIHISYLIPMHGGVRVPNFSTSKVGGGFEYLESRLENCLGWGHFWLRVFFLRKCGVDGPYHYCAIL